MDNDTPYSSRLGVAWWLRYCHVSPSNMTVLSLPSNNFVVPKEELRKLSPRPSCA
jgi:hypothetical protein